MRLKLAAPSSRGRIVFVTTPGERRSLGAIRYAERCTSRFSRSVLLNAAGVSDGEACSLTFASAALDMSWRLIDVDAGRVRNKRAAV
jgi:hypothetical protein